MRVFPFACSWFPVVVTVASVSLWEDKCLAGFMPLKALLGQPTISTDNASQNVCCGLLLITIESLLVIMLWSVDIVCVCVCVCVCCVCACMRACVYIYVYMCVRIFIVTT